MRLVTSFFVSIAACGCSRTSTHEESVNPWRGDVSLRVAPSFEMNPRVPDEDACAASFALVGPGTAAMWPVGESKWHLAGWRYFPRKVTWCEQDAHGGLQVLERNATGLRIALLDARAEFAEVASAEVAAPVEPLDLVCGIRVGGISSGDELVVYEVKPKGFQVLRRVSIPTSALRGDTAVAPSTWAPNESWVSFPDASCDTLAHVWSWEGEAAASDATRAFRRPVVELAFGSGTTDLARPNPTTFRSWKSPVLLLVLRPLI